jgi:hypothetical protein
MKTAPIHRGAIGDTGTFADKFIQGRLVGFEKDMRICLTAVDSGSRAGATHAYFPALAACFGTLEYFAGLYRGHLNRPGWQQIAEFAERYLPQPDFDREAVRVLFEAFRHPVAHRGIASGVWVDRNHGPGLGRRLTWKVLADAKRPACQVVPEVGELVKDPPWPCPYTHRVHIHLRALWIDIRKAASLYGKEVGKEKRLQANFETCMKHLYPT